jgi:hypothetical protein
MFYISTNVQCLTWTLTTRSKSKVKEVVMKSSQRSRGETTRDITNESLREVLGIQNMLTQ